MQTKPLLVREDHFLLKSLLLLEHPSAKGEAIFPVPLGETIHFGLSIRLPLQFLSKDGPDGGEGEGKVVSSSSNTVTFVVGEVCVDTADILEIDGRSP